MQKLKNEWTNFVKQWNEKEFGEAECLGCKNKDTLEQTKRYIIASIKEDYNHSLFNNYVVPKKTYSSKGMSELEHIIFLIEETGKILFPDTPRVMLIIFDSYNIKHGLQGIYDILGEFVKWVDLDDKQFKTMVMEERQFSSNLVIAISLLEGTQKILTESGQRINLAKIMKDEKIKDPLSIIKKCREYVNWQDVDGKF